MIISFKQLTFPIIIGVTFINTCINAMNINMRNEITAQDNEIKKRITQKIEYAKQQLNYSGLILKRNPHDTMEQNLKIEMLDYINYLTKLNNKSDISRNITPLELNMLGL